jgi:competence protein ComGC
MKKVLTLIEVIIGLLLLSILAALSIPIYNSYISKSYEAGFDSIEKHLFNNVEMIEIADKKGIKIGLPYVTMSSGSISETSIDFIYENGVNEAAVEEKASLESSLEDFQALLPLETEANEKINSLTGDPIYFDEETFGTNENYYSGFGDVFLLGTSTPDPNVLSTITSSKQYIDDLTYWDFEVQTLNEVKNAKLTELDQKINLWTPDQQAAIRGLVLDIPAFGYGAEIDQYMGAFVFSNTEASANFQEYWTLTDPEDYSINGTLYNQIYPYTSANYWNNADYSVIGPTIQDYKNHIDTIISNDSTVGSIWGGSVTTEEKEEILDLAVVIRMMTAADKFPRDGSSPYDNYFYDALASIENAILANASTLGQAGNLINNTSEALLIYTGDLTAPTDATEMTALYDAYNTALSDISAQKTDILNYADTTYTGEITIENEESFNAAIDELTTLIEAGSIDCLAIFGALSALRYNQDLSSHEGMGNHQWLAELVNNTYCKFTSPPGLGSSLREYHYTPNDNTLVRIS